MNRTNAKRGSWRQVGEHLKGAISEGKYAPGQKLPSESELMKELGVSKITVHRALQELASEGLIRTVERVGSFVMGPDAPGSRKIGLVLPTTEGFLEFHLFAGVREGLDADDQYVLYATDNDPVAEYEAINRAATEVDGIIILSTCHIRNSRRLQQLQENGFPIVCIDRASVGFDLLAVTTNNYQVALDSLRSLMSEKQHRVAYFGIYDPAVSSLDDRYRAYLDACAGQSEGDPTELVRFIPPHLGPHARVSFRLLEDSLMRLLTGENPITLAFCANEYYLEAIVQVCDGLPRELWENLEIVAFSAWPRLRYRGFRVHTIRQDAHGIGHRAADLLHQVLNGEKPESTREEIAATFVHADDSSEADFHAPPHSGRQGRRR